MQSKLFEDDFNSVSKGGLFASFIDVTRRNLRDAAKTVRCKAAWETWPFVHSLAKALQERLTTPGDMEAQRQSQLEAMAERCAAFYPHEGRFPFQGDRERMREELALTIGGGLTEDNPNDLGITLDDVLALYREKYAQEPSAHPEPGNF